VAPREEARDLPVGQGGGGAEPAQEGVAPEFLQFPPTAGGRELEGTGGIEYAGGGDDMHVRVPEEKIADGLHGDDEAGLAGEAGGALAEPDGEGGLSGAVEFVEQSAVGPKHGANQPGHGEHDVPVRYGRAHGVGDEGAFV
jgi:hypothetical protein